MDIPHGHTRRSRVAVSGLQEDPGILAHPSHSTGTRTRTQARPHVHSQCLRELLGAHSHLQLTGLQQPARLGSAGLGSADFGAWQWLPWLQPPIGHPALRPHPALLPLGVWLRPPRLP